MNLTKHSSLLCRAYRCNQAKLMIILSVYHAGYELNTCSETERGGFRAEYIADRYHWLESSRNLSIAPKTLTAVHWH